MLTLLAPKMSAHADGEEFFGPQEIPGRPVYVVFGSVRSDRGDPIPTAVVTVEVVDPILVYETSTTTLGWFRTVDIGREVTDLGYDVDPAQIKISVAAPGYVLVRRLSRYSPRQKEGAVEIDFVMKRKN